MARQDAYARDQAALDLARYEALLVDKQEADRALAEVRRLRAAAEQLSAEAFTDEARAQAAQHAAGARAAELNVTQLLADRTRELEELAARPHLARALADRQRHAEQQAEAAQRAEAERVVRRPYRDDPGAVMARLADLNTENLPEDLARRVFGLWSNACYLVVQQRGWLEPKRYAQLTSRGMVHARPTSDGPATTVSSLGMPEWRPGDVVDDKRVLRASRPVEPPKTNKSS